MALTDRKKKGLAFIVSGIVFVAAGAVLWFTQTTPPVVSLVIQIIGTVGNIVGLALTLPEVV